MFSSLFGGRNGGGSASKQRGNRGGKGGAGGEPAVNTEPETVLRPSHSETLEAVVATQKKRCRASQRHSERAEKRRDAYLRQAETTADPEEAETFNEKAAEAESLRKSKTALFITLQTQIDVLERVLMESGLRSQGLDEDLDAAVQRMERAEQTLREDREEVRAQRESAEEMSRMLSKNIAMPVDEDEVRDELEHYREQVSV